MSVQLDKQPFAIRPFRESLSLLLNPPAIGKGIPFFNILGHRAAPPLQRPRSSLAV